MSIVQKLEQSLAEVRNILDEWITVQTKWLYLEGVFIGGDIREQLPDEAKKFDDIDRIFIKVNPVNDAIELLISVTNIITIS